MRKRVKPNSGAKLNLILPVACTYLCLDASKLGSFYPQPSCGKYYCYVCLAVLLHISPLVSASPVASFFFTPLDVLIILGLQFLTLPERVGYL